MSSHEDSVVFFVCVRVRMCVFLMIGNFMATVYIKTNYVIRISET